MTIPKTSLLWIAAIVLLGLFVFSILFYHLSTIEFYFDVNKLNVENMASHPQIFMEKFYPNGDFNCRTPSGHWGRYHHAEKVLVISCPMHDSTFKTLMGLGFTPLQILFAKKEFHDPDDEDPVYELKVGDRIYTVGFGRIEQFLGNGIGIDRAGISWD